MSAREIRLPNADHPISIAAAGGRVTVVVSGVRIADSLLALTLREADYPLVQYVPREDVDMSQLLRTSHQTYCPYKGECSYFSIPVGGLRSVNAVWSYESPYPAVARITGHLAFYLSRVDSILTTVS
jgi:uncharacterized protein (DUF427 family)